ncbi:hypothetical protein NDU88_001540 [Pleurodeles waltl]|uniref:Uncharacterized protein n=1 Tax=Pleurodeles waltl TaxID=8319 RepID=A0AAV7WMG1_PLEWA|nr:hypothetical protein NDU88_001540 [Pleurodeles waltl]
MDSEKAHHPWAIRHPSKGEGLGAGPGSSQASLWPRSARIRPTTVGEADGLSACSEPGPRVKRRAGPEHRARTKTAGEPREAPLGGKTPEHRGAPRGKKPTVRDRAWSTGELRSPVGTRRPRRAVAPQRRNQRRGLDPASSGEYRGQIPGPVVVERPDGTRGGDCMGRRTGEREHAAAPWGRT